MINAGGLINISNELKGYNKKLALKDVDRIYDILGSIFRQSNKETIIFTIGLILSMI